jgi:signal transduction histidine kinase
VEDNLTEELQSLNQLVLCQLAISILPFDKKYSEFIHYGLKQIVKTSKCRICLFFTQEPVGDTISEICKKCDFYKCSNDEQKCDCLLFNEENIIVIPIRKGRKSFGYIALYNSQRIKPTIFASIRNFANIIAINIENNLQKDILERQNEEKDKRAAELVIANIEKDKRAAELIIANIEKDKRAAELIIANKELETFSYSVSHDLRAPLRHINGYVDLLLDRFYDSLPEKARHYLDTIADSSRQMGTLIDDLLQFSRIGRQEKRLADFDMNIVVQDAIVSIKQDNQERNIEWRIETLPLVYADKAMLQLVWTNLLSNAVKFTRIRKKAIIGINVSDENNEYIFSVHDNGVGFDMQYSHKLFGIFQRLHTMAEFEGTGIGLANVQHIISRHGGRTWAEAEPDKGATFNFSLPKNKEN